MTIDEAKTLLAEKGSFRVRAGPGVCEGAVVRVWDVAEDLGRVLVEGEPLWFGDQGYFTGIWPAEAVEPVADDEKVTM